MQSLNSNTMPLAEVIRTYEGLHGVSVARVGKAATQLGFMDRLETDLRSALTAGQPIPNWQTYVIDTRDDLARRERKASGRVGRGPDVEFLERTGQKISLTPYLERDENPDPPSGLDLYHREMLEAHLRGESLDDWPVLDWLVLEKPEPLSPTRPPSAWSSFKSWLSKILRF